MSVITELIADTRFITRFIVQNGRVLKQLDQSAPKAGDLAPDFALSDVTGRQTVRLSDFRGSKPVALVFGSYT